MKLLEDKNIEKVSDKCNILFRIPFRDTYTNHQVPGMTSTNRYRSSIPTENLENESLVAAAMAAAKGDDLRSKSTSSTTYTNNLSSVSASIAALNRSTMTSINSVLEVLPPPFNPHRRDNKVLFIQASFLLSLIVLWTIYFYSSHLIHPFRNPHSLDYQLAFDESFGFFNDIPSHIWKNKKQRVKNQPKHNDGQLGLRSKFMNRDSPAIWYQHNWDTEFTCPHERKVGGISDGSKWVCDPHRLKGADNDINGNGTKELKVKSKEKQNPGDGTDNNCLVYSFGRGSPNARTFDFAFETDLLKLLGGPESCEIHFFDHRLNKFAGNPPDGIILHPWSLEGSVDARSSRRNFMTLKETVQHLGHEGRELDVLRIDCEGCEWQTFREWLTSGISSRQILVTLHGAPKNDDDLFEQLEADNYVIFHREADTRYGGMWQEYGFLKLAPQFFDRQ